jgi:hypothetical protein
LAKKKTIGLFDFLYVVAAGQKQSDFKTILEFKNLEIIITEPDERELGRLVEGKNGNQNEYTNKIISLLGQGIPFIYPTPQPESRPISETFVKASVVSTSALSSSIDSFSSSDPIFNSISLEKEAKMRFHNSLTVKADANEHNFYKKIIEIFELPFSQKNGVLDFFNQKEINQDNKIVMKLAENYDLFFKYYSQASDGKIFNNQQATASGEINKINSILDQLEQNVIYAPQFIGEVEDMRNFVQGFQFAKPQKGSVVSKKTFGEYIMLILMFSFFSQANINKKGIKVVMRVVGSDVADDFTKEFFECKTHKELVQAYYDAMIKMAEKIEKNRVKANKIIAKTDKNKKIKSLDTGDIVDSNQIPYFATKGKVRSAAGKGETKADVLLEFHYEKGFLNFLVDMKAGMYRQKSYLNVFEEVTRYTPSSAGAQVSFKAVYEDPSNMKFISLKAIFAYILYNLISKPDLQEIEKFLRDKNIRQTLTYGMINTEAFSKNYRTPESDPVMMGTYKGLIWYTDFYKALFLAIFEKSEIFTDFGAGNSHLAEILKRDPIAKAEILKNTQASGLLEKVTDLNSLINLLPWIKNEPTYKIIYQSIENLSLKLKVEFLRTFERAGTQALDTAYNNSLQK